MRLKQAILEFLGNEFKLEGHDLAADTTFAELGASGAQLTDLLHRLQDALEIILPEEKVSTIETVGDLLNVVEEEELEA